MRDLADSPEAEWRAERARVETEGWGARLLSHQDDDSRWAAGAHFPATTYRADTTMANRGRPPPTCCHCCGSSGSNPPRRGCAGRSKRSVRTAVGSTTASRTGKVRWSRASTESPSPMGPISGWTWHPSSRGWSPNASRTRGGWNCEAEFGSVRSSFDTTINVLEGLLEFERATGGTAESKDARRSGEEYLLRRHLFRRLSTGEPADDKYLTLLHPNRWHYDVLRVLDYFGAASALTGAPPDARLEEAIEHVRRRRSADGTWPLDHSPAGRVWFDVDGGPEQPSRWLTLRVLRVLRWWDEAGAGAGTGH